MYRIIVEYSGQPSVKNDNAIEVDCPVEDRFALSYVAFHEDAERRSKRGQKQTPCSVCDRWVWPDQAKACPQFEPLA